MNKCNSNPSIPYKMPENLRLKWEIQRRERQTTLEPPTLTKKIAKAVTFDNNPSISPIPNERNFHFLKTPTTPNILFDIKLIQLAVKSGVPVENIHLLDERIQTAARTGSMSIPYNQKRSVNNILGK
ncbi:MAG: hypothetical protein JSS09_06255 [Verrucomicrobia bacterium]|nr:hypothetical protein [Verrucomicrobiota bacterium]